MKNILKKEINFNFIIILFIVSATSLMVMFYADLLSYKQVYLMDGNIESFYKTKAKTVGEFLISINVPVRDVDKMNLDKTSEIQKDMSIKIERAFPIKLCYNNEIRKVFATQIPVSAVLATNNIVLSKEDYINVKTEESVKPNMIIEVKDYNTEIIEKKIVIPYTEKIIYAKDLDSSVKTVVKEGINGEKIVKSKVTYMNGVEVKRENIGEKITKKPQEKIIKKGTANIYKAVSGKAYSYKKMISMTATAYTLSELKGSTGRTCLGLKVREGIVAVDPKVIPLRTKLYVEGYGEAMAGDTGGAIKGNKIDLYMDTLGEVNNYGRRKNVKVYILK
ncbi:MAG: hypothetical protein A2Y18_04425 [Clostridiales bacterium GWD2_32_19]|nr:MAG: hypothetical protein A2Y18_04425 [Clostridiales bacterium GWD2_32_19]